MIESHFHRFSELFAQLGLANDDDSIQAFVLDVAPLPPNTRIEDAPCWTPAQAALLRESLRNDADWAVVVDRLNVVMHRQ